MQRLGLLLLFWGLVGWVSAQTSFPTIVFSGTVTDAGTGAAVANYPVTIYAEYSTLTWYYSATLYTDDNGNYYDTTTPDTTDVVFYVYTQDCNNNLVSETINVTPGFVNAPVNFDICTGASTISADFTYQTSPGSYAIQFVNETIGANPLNYTWDFGDGTTSTAVSPTKTYSGPGNYAVTLTVSDGISSGTKSANVFVEGTVGDCNAGFSLTTDIWGSAYFFNTSTDVDPGTYYAALDFGTDLGTTNWYLTFPYSYNFPEAGDYRVCMAINDSLCASVFCDTIASSGTPSESSCIADFSFFAIGPVMQFYGQSAAQNPTVSWDFGDGSAGGNNINTSHLYTAPGTYTVCLTVTNPLSGCEEVFCKAVEINYTLSTQTQAGFTYTVQPNGVVYFTDASTPPGFLNYTWDFGNGNTSTLSSPAVAYSDTGWYEVCVVVTNVIEPDNAYSSFCDSIYIGSVADADSCYAAFSITVNPDSSITFNNLSYGNNFNSQWYISNSFYYTEAWEPNPTLVLPPGFYTVSLGTFGNTCNAWATDTFSVGGYFEACNADFSYTVQPSGLVQFNEDIVISDPTSVYQYWDFGNGFTSYVTNPAVVYNAVGTYQVTHGIFNLLSGCNEYITKNVVITEVLPSSGNCEASFTYTEDSLGLVTFTANATPDPDQLQYFWDFGDNIYSTLANNQHIYAQSGDYNVCLTILNTTTGCNDNYCEVVSATGYTFTLDCTADFSYFADDDGNFQFFSPPVTDSLQTQYYWDFDNSEFFDFTANPLINFGDSLPHYVCLTLADLTNGCVTIHCDTVTPFSGFNAKFSYQTNDNKVSFINTSAGSGTLDYQWTFGDGQVSTQRHPVKVYEQAGEHQVCLSIWHDGEMKNMKCETLMIENAVLSAPDVASQNDWFIYPNPVNDQLNMDIQLTEQQDIVWEVINVSGQKILSDSEYASNDAYKISVDVQSLSSGIYFLRLIADGTTISKKFVVSRK